jgi:signal-transduction protein with cAMP-binding, CBS, and nucleotidyltransferase domain
MNIFHVKHLPVVEDHKALSLISEEFITQQDMDAEIKSYELSPLTFAVNRKDHLFDIMSKMAENRLTVIPVIDDEDNYIGLITQEELLQFYGNSFSFKEPGSIIVLETTKRQYSLAQISSIIEAENGAILSSFLTSVENTEKVMITVKVNKHEIQRITKALKRYEYIIKATYTEQEYIDTLKDRYDLLMNYLDV